MTKGEKFLYITTVVVVGCVAVLAFLESNDSDVVEVNCYYFRHIRKCEHVDEIIEKSQKLLDILDRKDVGALHADPK